MAYIQHSSLCSLQQQNVLLILRKITSFGCRYRHEHAKNISGIKKIKMIINYFLIEKGSLHELRVYELVFKYKIMFCVHLMLFLSFFLLFSSFFFSFFFFFLADSSFFE